MPPKFREFFKQRNGRSWPVVGEMPPAGMDWSGLMMETMADYLDLIAAKVFGEDLEMHDGP